MTLLIKTIEMAGDAMFKAKRDTVMAAVYFAYSYVGGFKEASVEIVTHDAHMANDARMLFVALLGLPSDKLTSNGDGFSFVDKRIKITSVVLGKEERLSGRTPKHDKPENFVFIPLGKLSDKASSVITGSQHQAIYFNEVASVAA